MTGFWALHIHIGPNSEFQGALALVQDPCLRGHVWDTYITALINICFHC